MGNIKLNRWIAIIGSALFCSLGLYINVALCSFFVLVPFFLTTKATTVKSSFVNGFCIGAAVAIVMLHGMYGVLINYTQGNAIMALLGIAVVMVLLGFVFGALSLGQFFFSKNKNILINILSFTGFSVLLEWTCTKLFLGFPWIVYHPGQMLLDNNYTIQIGAYGGILMLSLWVIVVNYSIATIFRVQRWKLLPYPIAVIIIGFGCGYIAYQQAQKINMNSKPISVAILAENSSPDEKWDAENGNKLVQRLLDMNQKAAALKPNIHLWSESAVPWTYAENDDFVKEVKSVAETHNITQLLGMNTAYNDSVVYNSVYGILPSGKVSGIYHKQYLLDLVEQPLFSYAIPFLSTGGFYAQKGIDQSPIPTPYGEAGVIICNESLLEQPALELSKKGATYLLNASNDGWFSTIPFFATTHFLFARLRAVENRKPLVVNSNLGYSGAIDAAGKVILKTKEDKPAISLVTIYPNENNSFMCDNYRKMNILTIFMTAIMMGLHFLTKKE